MDDKFRQLSELGAADFEHIDGSLIDHLDGTKRLLASWSASTELQDAGLYHAAYGTAGFSQSLVSTAQRENIADIIGTAAEDIVYRYCACDREYVWPQFSVSAHPEFRDRFTGLVCQLTDRQLRDFCELTVANELEIAAGNVEFVDTHGQPLYTLFTNMRTYLSVAAIRAIEVMLSSSS